jgi:hypothetical protein
VNTLTFRSGARAAVLLVVVAALAALVLGGCRAGDRVASSVVSTAGSGPGAAGSPDPLADVEAVVGAVEQDLDADADVAGR